MTILVHSSVAQSLVVGTSPWQDLEAADHVVSVVRKHIRGEFSALALALSLSPSFEFSQEPHIREQ